MILPDVNVLLYAFRPDSELHRLHRKWLESVLNADAPFGISPQVLSSLIRIATNPKIFSDADPPHRVLAFANKLLEQPHCRIVNPGPRHWPIFCDLCRHSGARGNLVQDAWFAALAIEHECEWITADRDYAKFPGLRRRSVE